MDVIHEWWWYLVSLKTIGEVLGAFNSNVKSLGLEVLHQYVVQNIRGMLWVPVQLIHHWDKGMKIKLSFKYIVSGLACETKKSADG